MSTPSSITEAHGLARKGLGMQVIRNNQDVATMAHGLSAPLEGLSSAITGRVSNIDIKTDVAPVRGDFIEQHLTFPERIHHFRSRIHEYGTRRLLFDEKSDFERRFVYRLRASK